MKIVFLALSLLGLTACYQKHLILQAEVVSMTKAEATASTLKQADEVKEKWCIGDDPVIQDGTNVYGLADQVIYKAQGEGKRADFIVDARIWRDSDGCALLEGKLAKM